MTNPLSLKEGNRVRYRRGGKDSWSPREWIVKKIEPGRSLDFDIQISSGNLIMWVRRHELRKIPDRKEGV